MGGLGPSNHRKASQWDATRCSVPGPSKRAAARVHQTSENMSGMHADADIARLGKGTPAPRVPERDTVVLQTVSTTVDTHAARTDSSSDTVKDGV
jgi:hypothetical protein